MRKPCRIACHPRLQIFPGTCEVSFVVGVGLVVSP